jgi:hypothetical protein
VAIFYHPSESHFFFQPEVNHFFYIDVSYRLRFSVICQRAINPLIIIVTWNREQLMCLKVAEQFCFYLTSKIFMYSIWCWLISLHYWLASCWTWEVRNYNSLELVSFQGNNACFFVLSPLRSRSISSLQM